MSAAGLYRRPRLLVLLLALIAAAGLAALHRLPRQEEPALIGCFAVINTYFPGADAARVEALISEKIETALEEIEEIVSTSRTGVSIIELELEDRVEAVDEVWSRARNKLDEVAPALPPGVCPPEFIRRFPLAHTLLVGFTWTLDDRPQPDLLYRLARELEQRLVPLPGTQQTELFGAPAEEFRVVLDPPLLASLNFTVAEVSQAIQRADTKLSAGNCTARRASCPSRSAASCLWSASAAFPCAGWRRSGGYGWAISPGWKRPCASRRPPWRW